MKQEYWLLIIVVCMMVLCVIGGYYLGYDAGQISVHEFYDGCLRL